MQPPVWPREQAAEGVRRRMVPVRIFGGAICGGAFRRVFCDVISSGESTKSEAHGDENREQ